MEEVIETEDPLDSLLAVDQAERLYVLCYLVHPSSVLTFS